MLALTRAWVVVSASIIAGGWLLSLAHRLDAPGYAVLLVVAVLLAFWLHRSARTVRPEARQGLRQVWRRRFRRPLAFLFLLMAVLAVVGGLLHAPNMYDALTYRLPRMLRWMTEGRWHWILTDNGRLNVRGCGFEWMAMPLLIFTRTDRFFFLLNSISFCLLPGLIFSVFTRLGVRRRVAWAWMWLVPAGYSFVLQAGGDANDLFAAPYALAALDFALRARRSQRLQDLWISILAATLVTGVKASNLPLLLPWAMAAAPCWRLALGRPVALVGVGLWAALASYLPNALLNLKYCGDWSGAVLEPGVPAARPLPVLLGNLLQVSAQNLVPPVFPWAQSWNEHAPGLLPKSIWASVGNSLQDYWWKLGEMPNEDGAAPGVGLAVLVLVSLVWSWRARLRGAPARPAAGLSPGPLSLPWARVITWAPWVSALVFMARMNINASGRVLTPYVPLLLPALLRSPALGKLVRCRWWQRTALATSLVALAVMMASPSRPLWPAETCLGWLRRMGFENRLVLRAEATYQVYRDRADALAPVRQRIPSEDKVVGGLLWMDDAETSLWRPFGSRPVVEIRAADTPVSIRQRGIRHVVISGRWLEGHQITLKEWLGRFDAELVFETHIRIFASQEAIPWYLVRLRPATT